MPATTRGLLFVHSTPSALCPHIEWAVEGVLGMPVSVCWKPQPALPGTVRAEVAWQGPRGIGASLASTFRRWGKVRFEVVQEAGATGEGHRWCFTPNLGLFHASTNSFGDVVVPEEQIKQAMLHDVAGRVPLRDGVQRLLGVAWDEELDVFRHAAERSSVRWLTEVG